jgi:hypothetical protein
VTSSREGREHVEESKSHGRGFGLGAAALEIDGGAGAGGGGCRHVAGRQIIVDGGGVPS